MVASWGMLNLIGGMLFSNFTKQQKVAMKLYIDNLHQSVDASFHLMENNCDVKSYITIEDFRLVVGYFVSNNLAEIEGIRPPKLARQSIWEKYRNPSNEENTVQNRIFSNDHSGNNDFFDEDMDLLLCVLLYSYSSQVHRNCEILSEGSFRFENNDYAPELQIHENSLPVLDLALARSSLHRGVPFDALQNASYETAQAPNAASDNHNNGNRVIRLPGIPIDMYIQFFTFLIGQDVLPLSKTLKKQQLFIEGRFDTRCASTDSATPIEAHPLNFATEKNSMYSWGGQIPLIAPTFVKTTFDFNDKVSGNYELSFFNESVFEQWQNSRYVYNKEKENEININAKQDNEIFYNESTWLKKLKELYYKICDNINSKYVCFFGDISYLFIGIIFFGIHASQELFIITTCYAVVESILWLLKRGIKKFWSSWRHATDTVVALLMVLYCIENCVVISKVLLMLL